MPIAGMVRIRMRFLRFRFGFTLVESLVAVSILLAVTVGPVALVGKSLFSASFSRNDLIAYNLAQEGIELVRTIRDNNVLCASLGGVSPPPWNRNPRGGPLNGYYNIDIITTRTLICNGSGIITPLPITRAAATCDTAPLLINQDPSDKFYSYSVGTPSQFTRCVKVCSPPSAAGPCGIDPDPELPVIPPDDQMDIVSTISWMERGLLKSITQRDRLYNW